ncbi:MAG TPA: hypothetical protein VJB59_02810 [Bdellovibrionota bacterium]|nr:hypothetical protein [Bdellovibrionota bacterium]
MRILFHDTRAKTRECALFQIDAAAQGNAAERDLLHWPFDMTRSPARFRAKKTFRERRRKNLNRGIAQCPDCGSTNLRGRWYAAGEAKARLSESNVLGASVLAGRLYPLACPACRQKRDRFAQGVVELHGLAWRRESNRVFEAIGNTEQIERTRNDQERVLWSRTMEDVTRIYVSLPELARHIGRELHRNFKGKIEYFRSNEEPYLRVVWHSEW